MSLLVYTARYAFRDPDRLDITRSGAERSRKRRAATPGELLAPSSRLLWPHKRALELIDEQVESGELMPGDAEHQRGNLFFEYTTAYRLEMRESYRARRPEWDALLERKRVVLVCFCEGWRTCHRSLAAHFLRACKTANCGELS